MTGGAKGGSIIVAGIMSGTSADGVDVAVCRIGAGPDGSPRLRVLGHRGFPYARALRAAVLAAMDAERISVAELARLSWRLGLVYADAVETTCRDLALKPGLIGCHGQTLYHQATAARFLGASVRCTWQTGEPAVIAERMRCPVVSDLRPADLAAGGEGAPLVPMLDWAMFRSPRVGRVLQNLGGIANLSAIPAGAGVDQTLAFDTGPASMVIDGCMRRLFGRAFDRNGAVARQGIVLQPVVDRLLAAPYFSAPPPKSCGREQFGVAYVDRLLALCGRAGGRDADAVATATALTAQSVVRACRDFVLPHLGGGRIEYIVAGGGAYNETLMRSLAEGLEPLRFRLRPMADLRVAAEAKEAVAFALLAWLTWQRQPGNVVSATGASRPVVLGKVSFG